jgi:aspartate kinase
LSLFVQKYGGTSVGTLDRIKAVSEHIAATYRKGHKLLVVVSAMGQQTDELLDMALALSPRPPQRELDMLLSTGERISMSLLAIALNELKIPTLSFTGSQTGILTDNTFGNARIKRILGDRIRQALDQNKLVIVAGFQGMSEEEKEIVTLGRGGSDLTAIALAHVLKADRCQIFKDVDGVCTADPRLVPHAHVMSEMSWDSLSALTWYGSGVVHNRGVHLAKKFKIPLEIRSSFNLETSGTLVGSHRKVEKAIVHALTHRQEQSWIRLHQLPAAELHLALHYLWTVGEHPIFVQQSRSAGQTRVDLVLGRKFLPFLAEFLATHQPSVRLETVEEGVGCITVVGDGFWQEPAIISRAVKTLVDEPLLLDCKNAVLNIFLPQERLNQAIPALHRELLDAAPIN